MGAKRGSVPFGLAYPLGANAEHSVGRGISDAPLLRSLRAIWEVLSLHMLRLT